MQSISFNTREQLQALVNDKGFAVINNVYTNKELEDISGIISKQKTNNPNFRRSAELFAIRQFFKEIPGLVKTVFNDKLVTIIDSLAGSGYKVVKSIFFDKPGNSNWFVAYHQDLTISVDKKILVDGFGPWTVKQDQFSVQPPLSILEDNFTIRIHLDHTTEKNGALKIIPGSHLKGVYRPETIDWEKEWEHTCAVEKGGIMIMKPLLLHASGRTVNGSSRRVIHIEFSRTTLPMDLKWAEQMEYRESVYEL